MPIYTRRPALSVVATPGTTMAMTPRKKKERKKKERKKENISKRDKKALRTTATPRIDSRRMHSGSECPR